MRRYWISLLVAMAGLLAVSGSAQAVVLKNLGVGEVGVAPVPGTSLPPANVDTSAAACSDPALAAQGLVFANGSHPLCWRGGSTIHSNETFAFTWDADRRYWSVTRGDLEQFLANVATASGTFASPYAVTGQYTDSSGRAQNASKYGGGCVDYGSTTGGAEPCPGPGNPYPTSGNCSPTGTSSLVGTNQANDVCLTDAQIQAEVQSMVQNTDALGHTQPGYTPVAVVLLPAQVESCLDTSGTVCSANSNATAKFCSYHGQIQVNSQTVDYVVQPWTVDTGCDATQLPPLPLNPSPEDVSNYAGVRLVNPLSQGQISAIVNPGLDGWVAADGSEISDNGCPQADFKADKDSLNGASYTLHRAYNNAGAIESDPITYFGCAPGVQLLPDFVVPSAVDQGDVVGFDGSSTASTLLVPDGSYQWNFGDGQTANGPSVTHSYSQGGTYTVTLTVTDRGANKATLSQQIVVLGPDGNPVPPTTPTGGGGSGGGSGGTSGGGSGGGSNPGGSNPSSHSQLQAHIQLMPASLKNVLRRGISLRLTSNESANGFATITITRALAKRIGIKPGNRADVVIGRGTLSHVTNGTVRLQLHLAHNIASKLSKLRHATLTVHLKLIAAGGQHEGLVEAGRY